MAHNLKRLGANANPLAKPNARDIKANATARRLALSATLDIVLGEDSAKLLTHLAKIALGEATVLTKEGEFRPPAISDQVRAAELLLSYHYGKPTQIISAEIETTHTHTPIDPRLLSEDELKRFEELAFKAGTIDATPKKT